MASPTQWSWVWVGSGSWWWTGKPGVLHSMGLQRVGHDWVTELTDNIYTFHLQNVVFLLLYTRQLSHHQKCVSLTTMPLIPFSRSRLPTATSSPVTTRTLFPVSMRLFYLVWFAHLFCWLFVFLYCMYEWNQIVFVFTCVLSSFLVNLWDYSYYLEKGMANHFSILALRTPWTVWKVYSPYITRCLKLRGVKLSGYVKFYVCFPSIFIFDGCTSPSLVPNGIFKYSAHFLYLKRNNLKICAT